MHPRVKICGIRNEADLQCVIKAGVDAVGFIVDVPVNTHRKITPEAAAALCKMAPPFISTVLVTMPDDEAQAVRLLRYVRPDAVQLHCPMSPDALRAIAREDVQIIQHVPADENAHATIDELNGLVDAVILETPGQPGRGVVHDWAVSRRVVSQVDVPIILAGGLRPENVEDAVRVVRPYGVDAASGVETDGYKDPGKVGEFVRRAKGCIR